MNNTAIAADTTFNAAHALAAQWEGGLSDHPSDPGGITNHGISLRFLQDFAASQQHRDLLDQLGVILPVTGGTIRQLNVNQAKSIHKMAFWQEPALHLLPEAQGFALYDFSMNAGPHAAGKILQRALNAHGAKLTVDGKIGPNSRAAAEAQGNNASIIDSIYAGRAAYYQAIVSKTPSSTVFLRGWLNRNAASLRACKEFMEGHQSSGKMAAQGNNYGF